MTTSHAYVAVTNDLNQDQRMHRICGTLTEAGYIVTLVGRRKRNSEVLYEQAFAQKRFSLFFNTGVLFYLEYQIRLFIYLIFAASPKLIYSVDLDTAIPVRLAGLFKRSKTVHDAHELFTEVPELIKSPIKKSIWTMVGRMTMKGFDLRFTVNESLSKILGEKYNCQFISVRNLPLAKMKSAATLDFQNPFIWYQGVLNEGRGLEEIIQCMASFPNLDLRIAGEGDRSLTLRLLAEESIASSRIHFHGWMNPNDMHDWASNAWLGINLLDEKSGNYYHSLANRTFDFVQAELPTIHMDFPEYREIVNTYGVGELLAKLSIDEIKKMIVTLQVDQQRYNKLQLACKANKNTLTWEAESVKMVSELNSILLEKKS